MAERLKTQIMEKESDIDLICGPDSYRSLPRLLSLTSQGHSAGEFAHFKVELITKLLIINVE